MHVLRCVTRDYNTIESITWCQDRTTQATCTNVVLRPQPRRSLAQVGAAISFLYFQASELNKSHPPRRRSYFFMLLGLKPKRYTNTTCSCSRHRKKSNLILAKMSTLYSSNSRPNATPGATAYMKSADSGLETS